MAAALAAWLLLPCCCSAVSRGGVLASVDARGEALLRPAALQLAAQPPPPPEPPPGNATLPAAAPAPNATVNGTETTAALETTAAPVAAAASVAPPVAAADASTTPAAETTAAVDRQPLARREDAGPPAVQQTAAPEAQPEDTVTPAPPAKGYTPHPLVVAVGVSLSLLALITTNNLYERQRAGKQVENPEGEAGAAEGKKGDDSDSDEETLTTEPLSEDTYGMAIASMVRDMNRLSKETGSAHRGIRICRIVASFKLLLVNMALQTFLLVCIANFAAARAVFDIRTSYSAFETHMYGGHVYQSEHGYARGLDDMYFNASLFDSLPEDTKANACRIPFAQPEFLFVILLIWSLLVVGEIKESAQVFERLVASTERAETMGEATQPMEDGQEVIVKLTGAMKLLVTCFIVVPRILIASILLWLGCRWLSATIDFQNLVLNAVGLEFVLLLKELLYKSLVPPRDKRDTVRMHVSIAHEATRPTPLAFFGTFLWGFVAMAWVYLYIFCIQGVLPGYRWDVRDVCVQWMKDNYAGWS